MIHQSARRLNSIHQSARRLKSIHQKVDSRPGAPAPAQPAPDRVRCPPWLCDRARAPISRRGRARAVSSVRPQRHQHQELAPELRLLSLEKLTWFVMWRAAMVMVALVRCDCLPLSAIMSTTGGPAALGGGRGSARVSHAHATPRRRACTC
jgi:hypothetical protein